MDIRNKGVKGTDGLECCSKDLSHQTQLHMSSSMSIMRRHPSSTWTSVSNMPKEIAAYAIDQPVFTDIKARDIHRHETSDTLELFPQCLQYLQGDQLYEKFFVVSKMGDLIQKDKEKFFREIYPLLYRELKMSENEDFHANAAEQFISAVKVLVPSHQVHTIELLNSILNLMDSKHADLSNTWSETINSLIGSLPLAELEKLVQPIILSKAQSTHIPVRTCVALMIKNYVERLPASRKTFTPVITKLLDDPIPLVRGTMCQQLAPIFSINPSKDELGAYISNVNKDNDPFVKKSLLITILSIYKLSEMKPLHEMILGLFKRLIKEAYLKGSVEILIEFSNGIGEIAKSLLDAGSLNADSKLWFLDAFIQLSRYGLNLNSAKGATDNLPTGFLNFRSNMGYNRRHSLVETMVSSAYSASLNTGNKEDILNNGWKIRRNCAKDFLNFYKFSKNLINDFRTGVQPLLTDLIHDPHEGVRAGAAGSFWPLMEALGKSGHLIHGEFVYILSDDSLDVVTSITPHVAKILKVLEQGKVISPEKPTQALVEVGGALVFCEERLSQSNSWRVHTEFLQQLTILPHVMPGDYIYNNFIPSLFHRLLHLRQLPARMAVADALVCFLRQARRAKQREEIRRRITESFGKGKSVQDRMLFLYMSKRIISTFSRRYFREYFFDNTLNLANDVVANVRLKVANMMPEMKNTLQRVDDDKLVLRLDEVAQKLRETETDRDVLSGIDEAIQGMNKIAIRFAGEKSPKTKADADDEAKEREELYIESLEPGVNAPEMGKDEKVYYKTPKGEKEKVAQKSDSPTTPKPISTNEATINFTPVTATKRGVLDPERFKKPKSDLTPELIPLSQMNNRRK